MCPLMGFRMLRMSSNIGTNNIHFSFMVLVPVPMDDQLKWISSGENLLNLPCSILFAHQSLLLVIRVVFNPLWLPALPGIVSKSLAVKALTRWGVVSSVLFLEFEEVRRLLLVVAFGRVEEDCMYDGAFDYLSLAMEVHIPLDVFAASTVGLVYFVSATSCAATGRMFSAASMLQ
ncbi:hypothetical protein Tco_0009671 [Tanacetum coccineum]